MLVAAFLSIPIGWKKLNSQSERQNKCSVNLRSRLFPAGFDPPALLFFCRWVTTRPAGTPISPSKRK